MSREVITCSEHAACVLVTEDGVSSHVPGQPRADDAPIVRGRARLEESEWLRDRMEAIEEDLAARNSGLLLPCRHKSAKP
jgi:hypothetical protein